VSAIGEVKAMLRRQRVLRMTAAVLATAALAAAAPTFASATTGGGPGPSSVSVGR
jgi:hypothetical protein